MPRDVSQKGHIIAQTSHRLCIRNLCLLLLPLLPLPLLLRFRLLLLAPLLLLLPLLLWSPTSAAALIHFRGIFGHFRVQQQPWSWEV